MKYIFKCTLIICASLQLSYAQNQSDSMNFIRITNDSMQQIDSSLFDTTTLISVVPDSVRPIDPFLDYGIHYPWVQIGLFNDVELDLSKFNENGNFFYKSKSDSNIAAVLDANSRVLTLESMVKRSCLQYSYEQKSDSSGNTSNQFVAVLDYDLKSLVVPEILYLQSVGVLKISKDAADSLAHHILKVMENAVGENDAFDFIVYNHSTKSDIDKDTAYVKRERESGVFNDNLRETLKLNYLRIKNLKFSIAKRMGKNTFFIKNVPFGAQYRLLNINGAVIKRGVILKNATIQVPTLPIILMVGKNTMLLK